jgi:hypothetical protein
MHRAAFGIGRKGRALSEWARLRRMGAVEGERKTVTALFADIKGSTELMRHLDPEEARAIIDLANQADDRCGTLLQRVRRRPATRFLHRSVRRASSIAAADVALSRCDFWQFRCYNTNPRRYQRWQPLQQVDALVARSAMRLRPTR